jgi:hypothetical protein
MMVSKGPGLPLQCGSLNRRDWLGREPKIRLRHFSIRRVEVKRCATKLFSVSGSLMVFRRALLLSGIGVSPSQYGVRRMKRHNLPSVLIACCNQYECLSELASSIVLRRTSVRRRRNSLSLSFPASWIKWLTPWFPASSGTRRRPATCDA